MIKPISCVCIEFMILHKSILYHVILNHTHKSMRVNHMIN